MDIYFRNRHYRIENVIDGNVTAIIEYLKIKIGYLLRFQKKL
nr:MAG TPA: hypothetical protein [Caudoviricetes sp.]